MSLEHVCVWDEKDEKIGYRHITPEEANEKFPHKGVSANSGLLICELCAQNVCFTESGRNVRHFRHNSEEEDKFCEERQKNYSQYRSRQKEPPMPLRINKRNKERGSGFVLQLGFFMPEDFEDEFSRDIQITIFSGGGEKLAEYSSERLNPGEITYLNAGNSPCTEYSLKYTPGLSGPRRYWAQRIPGVNSEGTLFNAKTGKILRPGAKAYCNQDYYFLREKALDLRDLHDYEMWGIKASRIKNPGLSDWYLCRICACDFRKEAARIFLKAGVFLTATPPKYHPLWPCCVEHSDLIYHSGNPVYFYVKDSFAQLQIYPAEGNSAIPASSKHGNGKLYRIDALSRAQILSLGASGASGAAYLLKKDLDLKAPMPEAKITDFADTPLNEGSYAQLPKSKGIRLYAPFDGKAVILKNGRTWYIYPLLAETRLNISVSFGMEVQIFQGCDRIRTIRFEREKNFSDRAAADRELAAKLESSRGPLVAVPHSLGAAAEIFAEFPMTRRWIYSAIRRGKISQTVYRLLINYAEKGKGGMRIG